jgi:N-acylglucosamine 2-epimerase (GlcNAc 2-epimerase)
LEQARVQSLAPAPEQSLELTQEQSRELAREQALEQALEQSLEEALEQSLEDERAAYKTQPWKRCGKGSSEKRRHWSRAERDRAAVGTRRDGEQPCWQWYQSMLVYECVRLEGNKMLVL